MQDTYVEIVHDTDHKTNTWRTNLLEIAVVIIGHIVVAEMFGWLITIPLASAAPEVGVIVRMTIPGFIIGLGSISLYTLLRLSWLSGSLSKRERIIYSALGSLGLSGFVSMMLYAMASSDAYYLLMSDQVKTVGLKYFDAIDSNHDGIIEVQEIKVFFQLDLTLAEQQALEHLRVNIGMIGHGLPMQNGERRFGVSKEDLETWPKRAKKQFGNRQHSNADFMTF